MVGRNVKFRIGGPKKKKKASSEKDLIRVKMEKLGNAPHVNVYRTATALKYSATDLR